MTNVFKSLSEAKIRVTNRKKYKNDGEKSRMNVQIGGSKKEKKPSKAYIL